MGNDDVAIAYVAAAADSPLYRNAVGDELVYVQSGRARLESVFGSLDVGAGDYVVIPRATTLAVGMLACAMTAPRSSRTLIASAITLADLGGSLP